LTIALSASRKATWWKHVQVINPDRSLGDAIQTQDEDRGPAILRVPNDSLVGTRLMFSKAMELGVHTDIYELGDLTGLSGYRVDLDWLRDDIPDPDATTPQLEWRAGFRLLEDHWVIRQFGGGITHCDGDIISTSIEPLGPGREQDVELVLATDGTVTWWKALRFLNIFDDLVTETTVEGAHQRSAPIQGLFADLWFADLLLAKAKFLGKHEDKYEYQLSPQHIRALGIQPGTRIVFTWSADDLPRPDGCE
jgi:hypothetical protein